MTPGLKEEPGCLHGQVAEWSSSRRRSRKEGCCGSDEREMSPPPMMPKIDAMIKLIPRDETTHLGHHSSLKSSSVVTIVLYPPHL